MKNTQPIGEQVSCLTYTEKQKVLKIGDTEKMVGGVMLTVGCLCLIPVFSHVFKVGPKKLRGLFPAATITCGAMAILTVCYEIYRRRKFPFYSRKKYAYLKKQQKGKI